MTPRQPDRHITISVVTATLNRRHLLERAIRSVMAQGLDAVEHIVVDGASTDGTLDMLREFSHLKVISEPDRNLYEGWNKGIRRATGEFICILNSDDELPDGALEAARSVAARYPDAEMISGPVELARSSNDGSTHRLVIDAPGMVRLREQDVGPGIPLTNGRYIARRLFDRIGLFDERYRVISDRQFFLRAIVAGARNEITDHVLYRYHIHSGSLTLNDQAPSMDHSLEALRATTDGMAEAKTPQEYAAYRTWHAWTAFYVTYLALRQGHFTKATKTIIAAARIDPLFCFRLPRLIFTHIAERRQRRGHVFG